MDYMCAKIGVDRSSRFVFRARTVRSTLRPTYRQSNRHPHRLLPPAIILSKSTTIRHGSVYTQGDSDISMPVIWLP